MPLTDFSGNVARFVDINVCYLKRFEAWMLEQESRKKPGIEKINNPHSRICSPSSA